MDERGVETVVEALYDGAATPEAWSAALSALGGLADGVGAKFILWDRRREAVAFSAHGGDYEPGWQELYTRYYGAIDPRRILLERLPTCTIFPCHRYFGDDYVRESEFYNDYLIPSGVRYTAFWRFDGIGDLAAMCGIHRRASQGPFEPADLRLVERCMPHLRRAARIHCEFSRLRIENAAFIEALDRAAYGVIIVDRLGRERHLNRAAEEIVRRRDGLAIRYGTLTATTPADAASLRRSIVDAADNAASGTMRGGSALRVRRSGDQRPYEVFVAPLPAGEAGFTIDGGTVIVFVHVPVRRKPASIDRLARHYGLTPAEARLAAALASGKSPQDYAATAKLSINTVRWTLKQVFAKTETRRQPELVRLLLSGAADFGGLRHDG